MRYLMVILMCVFFAVPAAADIYMYVGDDGVVYFTNIVDENAEQDGYSLYMREARAPRVRDTLNELPNYKEDDMAKYEEIIRYAAHLYEMEYELIKAIIKVESNFRKEAVSNRGARGLMQIMPTTGTQLNLDEPFDPESNILAGTKYVKSLVTKFNNDVPLALAAYNAGPGAVTRHNNKVPPYKETRNYIKKVLTFYEKYKHEERDKMNTYTRSEYVASYLKDNQGASSSAP